MEDWEKHFLELLEGEKEIGQETGEKKRMDGDQEKNLEEKEIEFQLKKKEATDIDGIVEEAWLYSDEQI